MQCLDLSITEKIPLIHHMVIQQSWYSRTWEYSQAWKFCFFFLTRKKLCQWNRQIWGIVAQLGFLEPGPSHSNGDPWQKW